MRDNLRSLEGQLVTIYGRNKERKKLEDGRRFSLIKNPVIRPWDGNSRIDLRSKGIKVDHVWIALSPHSKQPLTELLKTTITVGTVGYYTRADGSLDLGIRDMARIVNIDNWLEFCISHHEALMGAEQWRQVTATLSNLGDIQYFLDGHGKRNEHGEVQYVISQVHSTDEARAWVKQQIGVYERLQASLLRCKAGHQAKQKPHAQRSPSPGSAILLGGACPPPEGLNQGYGSELQRLLNKGCS